MGLSLEILWFDEDMVELGVRCENGRFAATTECYAGPDVFTEMAAAIQGFPTSVEDRRVFEIGPLSDVHSAGGFRLELRCVDPAGHTTASVGVRSPDKGPWSAAPDCASFSFPVEPAAIDDFTSRLTSLNATAGTTLELRQAKG